MNSVCAYCGVRFTERTARSPSGLEQYRRPLFVAALLLPIVGLVAGLLFIRDASAARRSAGRLWLIAGVFSSLVYAIVWLI